MNLSYLISKISRILFPFIILFGIYIIIHGDTSPGGGFQGGAILATCFLIAYIVRRKHTVNIHAIVMIEKVLYLLLLLISCLSIFTRSVPFASPVPLDSPIIYKRMFLMVINFIIAIKVAIGFVTIFSLFIQNGDDTENL